MINAAKSLFYQRLESAIKEYGGMLNAHLHLDRAGTLDEVYLQEIKHKILDTSYISLHEKHSIVSDLHKGKAYEFDDLNDRVNAYLDYMISVNTTRADTLVDVTADRVGLFAMQTMLDIKREKAGQIELMVGSYSPLGFTDSEPQRWELFVEGAKQADFIAALPEADDLCEYPTHIGFYEHCRRTLLLAKELNKSIHVHVDQRNEPSEDGTEQLIRAVREFGAPVSATGEPMVWAIHLISPSTYDEARFNKMLEGMVECNIGVVSCPSAAIGMRQLRPLFTPTYNSIPRILEMLAAGVHVRLGSDNIADICSPSTTANLIDEVFVLSAAIRFYHPEILAKLAAGVTISEADKDYIKEHLRKNDQEIEKILRRERASNCKR